MLPHQREPDRGVSPIVGVALTVAITVILAAAIGVYVLDFGQVADNAAPSASLTVDADTESDNLTVTHTGGDKLHTAQTRLVVRNRSTDATFEPVDMDQATVLSVGAEARIDLSDGDNGVDWDGDGTHDVDPASGTHPFDGVASDNQYTITVIDMGTERVIYETTITV